MSRYETWNPMTGCTKVSPGCDSCYAIREALNLQAAGDRHYRTDGPDGRGFGYAEHADLLDLPHRWAEPRHVFVNSRSDVFHEQATKAFVAQVLEVMAATPRHTYVVLTKRAAKMRSWLQELQPEPLPNFTAGVTIETQAQAFRLRALVETPAALRYVEVEPLLGPLDLDPALLAQIDQVVVGGEHGPNARPAPDADWVRSLRDQTKDAGAAFYFKQWGTGVAGRQLDGRTWSEWPSAPHRVEDLVLGLPRPVG